MGTLLTFDSMKLFIATVLVALSTFASGQNYQTFTPAPFDPQMNLRMQLAGSNMVRASNSRLASFCVLIGGGAASTVLALSGSQNDRNNGLRIGAATSVAFTTLHVVAVFRDRKAGNHLRARNAE